MGQYMLKLQSRYGDPRVYQAQEQEMRQEEAAILYDRGRRREDLLQDAYKTQVEKHRADHKARFKTLSAAQSKRLESQEPQRHSRTRKQPSSAHPAHPQDSVVQPKES